jgi:hypothetical protein
MTVVVYLPCCDGHVKAVAGFPFLDLSEDLQRRVLASVPLRQWAQLACMKKSLRILYSERVRERDQAVAARLGSDLAAESREGLASAQTSLPRDLIVEPPVRLPSIAFVAGCTPRNRGEAGAGEGVRG